MRNLFGSVLELLFPTACARCGDSAAGAVVCDACIRALPRLPLGGCPRCRTNAATAAGAPCAPCSASRSSLCALVAQAPYEDEIERFVQRFKYPRRGLVGLEPAPEALVTWLLLAAAARISRPAPDLVVPVPQHPAGLRRRGFNPAAVLARALARAERVRVEPRALERLRDGPSQTGLDRAERRRNVANAFRARHRVPAHIWLVDDVVTTGATLDSAARALRLAGARRVTGICAARTPLRGREDA